MNQQHTPGPWTICTTNSTTVDIRCGRDILVAEVGDTSIEDEANARLIAAAPDLLAHLTRLVAAIDRLPGNNPLEGLADEARAAIAKATAA